LSKLPPVPTGKPDSIDAFKMRIYISSDQITCVNSPETHSHLGGNSWDTKLRTGKKLDAELIIIRNGD
jgi:hypothetical protein